MEVQLRGRRVFAATGGRGFDPALPTVAFLHGAGMDHTVWALQTRWFAHHGRNVLAFDLPGHGRSEGPALRSIPEMAAWVLEALATLGAGRARLVGHSMGALVALAAAAEGGERVGALALLGMTPLMPVHPELIAAAESGQHKAIELMTSWAVGRRAQLGGNEAPGLWLTEAAMRLLERADPKALASDLVACDAWKGADAAAAKVACPTLLLCGADDRMTPAAKAAPFARAFKEARLEILPNAGHMMMVEDPTATLAALRRAV
jgi:pimeloyl-ACP methyl ester carboxylesterase